MKTTDKVVAPPKGKQLHGVIAECKACGKLMKFGTLTKEGFFCTKCFEAK